MTYVFATILGMDSQSFSVVAVAFLGLIGTIATVGYKYKNVEKKKDPNQIIFDQVNNFIAEQRRERDDLRKELAEVKKDVTRLTRENETLRVQLDQAKLRNSDLEKKVSNLKKQLEQST